MKFKKTKLATAVGTAAMAMALSAPANAVVVGGDNGWEVSFTGTINLFYNFVDWETNTNDTLPLCTVTSSFPLTHGCGAGAVTQDSSHLQEGLLPAFFTFKAKSPTVNGLTGTAQISFAPDSSSAKTTRNDKGGSAIDMREVFFNVDGSFGTISAGRTLGLFQRQAILKDQTLFGVGGIVGPDGGGTTLGRIGYGYIYPEFRTRFSYKTPVVNGFQLELGIFDPQEPVVTGSSVFETDTPQFQGEATYNTTFQGGNIGVWVGGVWQEMSLISSTGFSDDTVTTWGINVGGSVGFSGFEVLGSYYTGEALGVDFQTAGGGGFGAGGGVGSAGLSGLFGAPGFMCTSGTSTATCDEADNDGFYVQGSYTFNGKTKIAGSYGESNQNDSAFSFSDGIHFNDVSHEMWTIGVYHDVTSWLKLVAEYNDMEQTAELSGGLPIGTKGTKINEIDAQIFSVGGFIFW